MVEESRGLAVAPPRLPYPADAAKFGFDVDTWRVLTEAIFPGARSQHSVILALAYCKSRGLDPLKRPIHIVPVWDSKRNCEVETIWPGIGELRTTAARTGEYGGKDKTLFGETVTQTFKDEKGEATVSYPEWAQLTVYRIVKGIRCAFEGPRVYWKETYATRSSKTVVPNQMWADRPSGQLEKCAEAAALRSAFPEEIGNDYAAEEMEGRKFETFATTSDGNELMRPKRKSEALPVATATPVQAATVVEQSGGVDPATLQKVLISGATEKVKGESKWFMIAFETSSGAKVEASTFAKGHFEAATKLKGQFALVAIKESEKKDAKGNPYINLTHIEAVGEEAEAPSDEPGSQG